MELNHLMVALVCFLLPAMVEPAQNYQNKITTSQSSHLDDCKKLNNTTHQCSSLQQVFNMLSYGYNSIDIVLEPGIYNLKSSYNVTDIQHIRISSNNATIQCMPNVNERYEYDTGIAFIRVTNLVIEHVSITGCGMRHISSNFGKGKFIMIHSALFVQNSTNITLCNMSVSNSNGIGLIMYDTNGEVNITGTYFINNKLNMTEQRTPMAGGGGVYIHFTNCAPGVSTCNTDTNPFNKDTIYVIDKCSFQNNNASYHLKDIEFDNIYGGTFVTFGSGGGISVWFYGNAHNNTLNIKQSSFINNTAGQGGGINMRNKQNANYNYVKISHCYFTNNTSIWGGGGGGIAMGYEIYQEGGRKTTNNRYIVESCSFSHNKAVSGVGGGISLFGSREPETLRPTNHFIICNSSFAQNEALYGSAIEINRQYFESILVGTIFTLIIDSCIFTNNSLYSTRSEVSSIGTVSTSGVNIKFTGTTIFSGNNLTALAVDGAVVEFFNNSVINFTDNHGLHSGGIHLISNAWIKIYPNCTVSFIRNTAVHYSGAIYVELSTPFDYILSRVCFVRYYLESISPKEWNFTFIFKNNSAGENNNTIFVTTIQPCVKAYTKDVISWLVNGGQIKHYPITSHMIATAPAKFNITMANYNNTAATIIPGEVFDLPVQLLDERNQIVQPAIFIATCSESPSPYVMSPYHFTNGTIQIAGKQNEVCHLTLQTDTNYQITTTLHITLSNCPPGFIYKNRRAQCECIVGHNYDNPAITGCKFTTFQAYFNQFYWIGYASDNSTNLITSFCPYGYCYKSQFLREPLLPRRATKSDLDAFVCGYRKRTGLLCGRCIIGYSVALNSPMFKCHHCTNYTIGILYLFLSYLVPVSVLFYFIMAYNIRITTGPVGAFLFFSQMISSQYHYEFDSSLKVQSDEILTTSNVILTIYRMSNLDFFHHNVFSYCLFSRAGTVDILAFNLLLSLYPLLLVLVYFLLRQHCKWKYQFCSKFKLSSTSVTHGICAFLILSSTKVNALAFRILKSADLKCMNGTLYKKVVYFQGDIEYFNEARYNVYAAGALFTITTIIFIPTLILVLHPIMITTASYFKWGDSKCVRLVNKCLCINKLKPLLDSFQGDYKDNLSFFAGLHSFLYRSILLTIVITASTPEISCLLFLVQLFLLAFLIIHMTAIPFKKSADNIVHSLVYSMLLAILIIEYYIFTTGESSEGLLWLQTTLLSLPLVCVIVYYSWKLFKAVQMTWKKQCHNTLELVSV